MSKAVVSAAASAARIRRRSFLAHAVSETLEQRRLLAAPQVLVPPSSPGDPNYTADGHFDFEDTTQPQRLVVGFDQSVTLTSGAMSLTNLTSGQTVSQLSESGSDASRTWAVGDTGDGPGILQRGNYELLLNADKVTNAATEKLDGNRDGTGGDDYISGFFFQPGDADHNRVVNADDYGGIDWNILVPGTSGYHNGDFNYDGVINADDYGVIDAWAGTALPPPPSQPNTITAAAGRGFIDLAWTAPLDTVANGFHIYRSLDAGETWTLHHTVVDAAARSWPDEGLEHGTKYTYRIRAYSNTDGLSLTTNKYSAVTNLPGPKDLYADAITETSAVLHWTDTTANEAGFEVLLRDANGDYLVVATVAAQAGTGAVSFPITGSFVGQQSVYSVRAFTAAQKSANALPVGVMYDIPVPANFAASPVGRTSLTLHWDQTTIDGAGYRLQQLDSSGAWVDLTHITDSGESGFDVEGLTPETNYAFRVSTVLIGGTASAYSAPISVQTLALPPAPTNLVPTLVAGHSMTLEWSDNSSDETSFEIELSQDDGMTFSVVATADVDATSYSLGGLIDAANYDVRIRAVTEDAVSVYSNVADATLPFAGPTGFTAVDVGAEAASLTWLDASDVESGYTLYKFDGSAWQVVQTFAAQPGRVPMSHTVGGLVANAVHIFRITGTYSGGTGSQEVELKTRPPSIALGNAATDVGSGDGNDGVNEVEFEPGAAAADYALELRTDGFEAGDLRWEIDWGDGAQQVIEPTGGGAQLQSLSSSTPTVVHHAYAAAEAAYAIKVKAIAADGGTFGSTAPVQVVAKSKGVTRVLRAFEWVYNNIRFEPKFGAMNNTTLVEETRAGSAWEQAQALVDRLARGKYLVPDATYQLVEGRRRAPASELMAWLGVKDLAAAASLLHELKLNPEDKGGGTFEFDHVWVRASVPGADAFDLDPSWKFKDLPSRRSLVDGIGTSAAPFDRDHFIANSGRQTPLEYYEGIVQGYLRSKQALDGVSLADVPYDGPIIAKRFSSPPDYGAGNLISPLDLSKFHSKVPDSKKHLVEIRLLDSAGAIVTEIGGGLPEHGPQMLYLKWTEGADGRLAPEFRRSYFDQGAAVIDLPIGAPATRTFSPADKVTIQILQRNWQDSDKETKYERSAGTPLGIGLGAGQWTDAAIMRWQEEVNKLALAAAGALPGSEEMQKYQGNLLAVAQAKYLHDVTAARRTIAGLTQTIDIPWGMHSGVMSGDRFLAPPEYLDNDWWRLQNPIISRKLLTDNKGLLFKFHPTQGAMAVDPGIVALAGYQLSALEHEVIEQYGNADGLSTVKGMQWAAHNSFPVLELSKATPNYQHFIDKELFFEDSLALSKDGRLKHYEKKALHTWIDQARDAILSDVEGNYTVRVPSRLVKLGDGADPSNPSTGDSYYKFLPSYEKLNRPLAAVWYREDLSGPDPLFAGLIQVQESGVPAHGGALLGNLSPFRGHTANNINAIVVGDPVNQLSGGLEHDETDLAIPGAGMPLAFARHYDSQTLNDLARIAFRGMAAQPGITASNFMGTSQRYDFGMGLGWTHSYSDRLYEVAGTDDRFWYTSDGNHLHFKRIAGTNGFRNPAGTFGTLTQTSTGFEHREVTGLRRMFDTSGRLVGVRDKNDNGVLINYDAGTGLLSSVVDAHHPERFLKFYHRIDSPPQGPLKVPGGTLAHIDRVVDFTGREWKYEYDSAEVNVEADAGLTTLRFYVLRRVISPSAPAPVDPTDPPQTEELRTGYEYHVQLEGPNAPLFGLLTAIVNENTNARHTYNYHPNRRVSSTVDGHGNAEYFSAKLLDHDWWDTPADQKSGISTTYIDPLGNTTTYKLGTAAVNHQVTRVIYDDRSRQDSSYANFHPATWGGAMLEWSVDDIGRYASFTYDPAGNVATTYTVLNRTDSVTTSYTYDGTSNGVKDAVVTATVGGQTSQRESHNTYTASGDLQSTQNANLDLITYTYGGAYGARGLPDSMTRPRGNDGISEQGEYADQFKTIFEYDPLGSGQVHKQTIQPRSGQWVSSRNDYDARGNVKTVTDATGRIVNHAYDVLDHKVSTSVDPDGVGPKPPNVTRYTYLDGRLHTSQDARAGAFITTMNYDKLGRLVQAILPDNSSTYTAFDGMGNIIGVTDAVGNLIVHYYDNRNRKIQTVYADGSFERTHYDGGGRAIAQIEPLKDVSATGIDPTAVTTYAHDYAGRATHATDAIGQKTEFEYNGFGDLMREEFFYPDPSAAGVLTRWRTTDYTTDALGRVVTRRGDDGLVTTAVYDDDGNATEQWTYLLRASDGSPLHADLNILPEENKRVTVTTFDALDRPVEITDALGNTTHTEYDDAGRVTAVVDARWDGTEADKVNHTTTSEYDEAGQLKTVIQPPVTYLDVGTPNTVHPVTAYEYDEAGNLIQVTDPRAKVTTYKYDSRNRQTRVYSALHSDVPEASRTDYTETTYYGNGQIRTTRDQLGRVTESKYDARGRLVRQILPDPQGDSATRPDLGWFYNAAGTLAASANATGEITSYEYDPLRRVTKTTMPAKDGGAAPTAQNHYLHNDLIATTDERGYQSYFDYDKAGRAIATYASLDPVVGAWDGVRLPNEALAHSAYDNLGNLVQLTAHLTATRDEIVDYGYDKLDRRILERRQDPQTAGGTNYLDTRWVYDELGNVIVEVDAIGGKLIRDAYGPSPTQEQVKSFGFDGSTSANIHATTYAYDNLNRKIRETTPDPDRADGGTDGARPAATSHYAYDANGNVLRVKDPAGHITRFEYDAINRKSDEYTNVYTDASTPVYEANRHFEYDDAGNLQWSSNRNGEVTSYSYDALNRLESESWPGRSYVFTYDDAGRRLTATDSAGPEFVYDYWDNGWLKTIDRTDVGGTLPTIHDEFDYHADGSRKQHKQFAGGSLAFQNDYEPDHMGRTNKITQAEQAGLVGKEVGYLYRRDGSVGTATRKRTSTPAVTAAVSTFAYDLANRLDGISHAPAGGSAIDYVYGRNDNGQVTSFNVDGVAQSYTYDFAGQLMSDSSGAGGPDTYNYDPNGNRTAGPNGTAAGIYETQVDNRLASDGKFSYEYDREGRLLKKTDLLNAGNYTQYAYDARNHLVQVDETLEYALAKTVRYTYDVDDRRTSKVVDAYSAAGGSSFSESFAHDGTEVTTVFTGSGQIKQRYLFGPRADDVLAEDSGDGAATWQLPDHQGSIRNIVAIDGGNPGRTIDYDAFGNVMSTTEGEPPPVIINGSFEDPALADGTMSGSIPGWTIVAAAAGDEAFILNPEAGAMAPAEGQNLLRLGASDHMTGVSVRQVVGTLKAGVTYVLSAHVALDGGMEVDQATLSLWSDGTELASESAAIDPFFSPVSVTYTAPASGTLLGQPLEVRLTAISEFANPTPDQFASFDAVTLSTTGGEPTLPRFLYTGQEHDGETGLNYYGARYYDPQMGRFLNQDPARDGRNWYAYVGNDPVNLIDPTGLSAVGHGAPLFDKSRFALSLDPVPSSVPPTSLGAEGLFRSQLMDRAAAVGSTYLPVSGQSDIYRSALDGNYYQHLPAGDVWSTPPDTRSWLSRFEYALGLGVQRPPNRQVKLNFVQVPPPDFSTSSMLYERSRAIDEYVASVLAGAEVAQGVGDFVGGFNPVVNATTAITGQNASGTNAGGTGRVLAGAGIVLGTLTTLKALRHVDNLDVSAPPPAVGAAEGPVFGGSGFFRGGTVGEVMGGGQPLVLRPLPPTRIYSARELIRRSTSRSDQFHNFPESFNAVIFDQGTRTTVPNFWRVAKPGFSNDSVMYRLRGSVTQRGADYQPVPIDGTYEIFVRPSVSGNTEVIMHRYFNPD